jgi:hypothetical protein
MLNALTPRRCAARVALIIGALIVALLAIWLVASGRFFGSSSTRGVSRELLPSATNADAKVATRTAQAGIENSGTKGGTSAKVSRTPTIIGNVFEAFGKPADVEVCGFGVQHVEEYPIGISMPPVTAANTTLNAIARDLASSKLDADRALGLYLQAKLAGDAAMERAQIQEPGCGQSAPTGSGKPDNPPCSAELVAAKQAARLTAAKPLIEMALGTRDPNVYATAYYICSLRSGISAEARGACASISAEGWARLDPQNLYPALLARNPGPFKDGSYKLPPNEPIDDSPLPTSVFDARTPRFDRVMTHDNFKQEPLYMQSAITESLMGDSSIFDFRYVSSALNYCRPAEVARSSRSQICSSVAEVFGEKGKSSMELMVALKMGERGMLSAAQIAKLKAEKAAYEAHVEKLMNGVSAYSCEGMALSVKYFANLFALGDRAMIAGERVDELNPKPSTEPKVKP